MAAGQDVSSQDVPDGGAGTRAFKRFWMADIALRLGGRVWTLALPVIAIEYLAGDSRHVGYLASAATVSYLLFGLPAGVWVDRWDKRRVMMGTALVRACLLASIPIAWLTGLLTLPYLLVVALLIGIASLFYDIAHQSYIPILVGAHDTFTANARLETTSRAANASGPAVVGFAMKFISVPMLVLFDAFSYLICAVLLSRVPEVETKGTQKAPRKLSSELLDGFRFIWGARALRVIALAVVLSNFFATAITTLIPVIVLKSLDLGTASLGVVYTSAEVGGLVGALMLGRLRAKLGIGRLLAGGLLVAATFTVLVPFAASMSGPQALAGQGLLMLSLFGTAVGGVLFAVSQISLRQSLCPKELMGRVNASMRFIVWGTMPFASIGAGLCAHHFGNGPTLWLAVIGAIVTVLPILGIAQIAPGAPGDAPKRSADRA